MGRYEPGGRLLAEVVRRRRERLGITQEDVVRVGGPSIGTMRTIENAQADSFRPKTLRSLDVALGWEPGASQLLLGGFADPAMSIDKIVDDLINRVTSTDLDRYQIPYRIDDGQGKSGIEVSGPLPRGSGSDPAIVVAMDPPVRSGSGTANLSLDAHGTGSSKREAAAADGGQDANELLREALEIAVRLPYEQLLQLRAAVDATERARQYQISEDLNHEFARYASARGAAEEAQKRLKQAEDELSKLDEEHDDPRLIEVTRRQRDQAEAYYLSTHAELTDTHYRMTRLQEMLMRSTKGSEQRG